MSLGDLSFDKLGQRLATFRDITPITIMCFSRCKKREASEHCQEVRTHGVRERIAG